ncbi:hypothetical protein KR054_009345, partial [Drosophila jambulina]
VETTEVPELIEATTITPSQVEESLPTQTSTNQNDTAPAAHPVENPKADATDPAVFVQPSGAEVQDSFVSVYAGNLEQDIRNDVNSEVEEAPSPAETLKETALKAAQVAEVAPVETENRETEAAVQNAREPKTLENPEEEEEKPAPEEQAEPEAVTENIALASEQVESRSQDNPDSLSLNENQAVTEPPITKTNLLALEQEHKAAEGESSGTPVPTYEEPKHQVTKKQGVEDLLPIEVAPEVVEEEEPNPDLNEIDGNASEDEKADPNTFLKSDDEQQEESEKKAEEEARVEIERQVEGTAPPEETVVEAADTEDSQPGEEEVILGTTEKSVSEEAKPIVEEPKEDEHTEVDRKDKEPKEEETKEEQLKEAEIKEEEPTEEEPKEDELKEDQLKGEQKDPESSEPKEDKDGSNSDSSEETHEPAADEAKPSSSDDSTATPLVSYPPHDAGQTFDSNSADEHSAQLSGPSNYRSTLIIALCSGTAVIFIVASLVIFVVSFQRQHGTLDIEMQEQRLGKDDRDEEDAQVKLLEVDLSTPVIVSLGNEETDECL